MYQPKTGEKCHCKPGIQRDNCQSCEGTGMRLDFKKIHDTRKAWREENAAVKVTREFKVVARSENTGAFGHRQFVVVARNGEAWTIEIIPSNAISDRGAEFKRGDVFKVALDEIGRTEWAALSVECPERRPDCPKKLLKEIFK